MADLAESGPEPEWVASMRQHHLNTGNYRQEDVYRLLGAPWQRVEINLTSDVPASCVQA